MIPLLDELDEGARLSGAVNTVVIEDSTLHGYNTDGGGMVMACQEAGIELSGRRVLLLGAGGAAAIAVAFGGGGIGELNIANRSAEHAIELQNKLRGVGMEKVVVCPLDALDEAVLETEIIVNATSLGMKEGIPCRYRPGMWKMVGRSATRFIVLARRHRLFD
jgi:shikimate dehydrogenase